MIAIAWRCMTAAETAAANDRLWALIRDGLRARGLPPPRR